MRNTTFGIQRGGTRAGFRYGIYGTEAIAGDDAILRRIKEVV